MLKSIYIAGSLRNPEIPVVANKVRTLGIEAFDAWFSPGPDADTYWKNYCDARGQSYKEALADWPAKHIYEFDKQHLDRCEGLVLVLPAGKSAHMELGYAIGCNKPAYVLFDKEPERYDVMYQFATEIFFNVEDFLEHIKNA